MPELLVNVDVPDLQAALAFYRDGLGLALRRRIGAGVLELGGAGVPVFLIAQPAAKPPFPGARGGRDYGRHWTPVHLDLVVEDVHAAVARATAAGAHLERGPEDHVWGRIAVLADPFGHGLCLLRFSERGYEALGEG